MEPPGGDAYRSVMPVAPGVGRYFVPLNRGKRSVVPRPEDGGGKDSELGAGRVRRRRPAQLPARTGGGVRARLARRPHGTPGLVVGVVTSFGPEGPLAGAPAYDLVAQGRSGLHVARVAGGCRACAGRWDPDGGPGGRSCFDRRPGRARASARHRCRRAGRGLAARSRARVQARTSSGSRGGGQRGMLRSQHVPTFPHAPRKSSRDDYPYYRCYAAADGFLALACLDVVQRRAFAAIFGLDDPTIEAPDLVPADKAWPSASARSRAGRRAYVAIAPVTEWARSLPGGRGSLRSCAEP